MNEVTCSVYIQHDELMGNALYLSFVVEQMRLFLKGESSNKT